MGRRIVVLAALGSLLAGLAVTAQARMQPELSPRQRGMVMRDLSAKDDGRCRGFYRIRADTPEPACTHGPDRGPAGVDVSIRRTVADLTADATTTSTDTSGVPCIGDGASGPRVQAVYAVSSDLTDRYTSVAPLIATWASQMDGAVNQSAAETGGERHIRFATNPDCSLNVAKLVLSPTGDDSFGNTITELRAAGFSATDRKYLIWADATVYCGIGQVAGGDSAAATNGANSGPTFARVDSGCWGRSDHLSELHELMHTLGAVQLSAPHSSGGYHCTDENDAMCYPDGSGVTMTYPCPSSHEWLLDCNHDDYFHTSPASGSYLDTHWNVADSVFLAGGTGSIEPPPAPTPTSVSYSGSISAKRSVKVFPLAVGDGPGLSELRFAPTGKSKGGTPTMRLRILRTDGTVVSDVSGPSVLDLTTSLARGTYTWEVSGSTSVSFSLTITYTP